MLEDEFRDASRITGKSYDLIADYYVACKKSLDATIHTEFEFYELKNDVKDLALSFTRDYVWFDEKMGDLK
jgi:hypothetical protein